MTYVSPPVLDVTVLVLVLGSGDCAGAHLTGLPIHHAEKRGLIGADTTYEAALALVLVLLAPADVRHIDLDRASQPATLRTGPRSRMRWSMNHAVASDSAGNISINWTTEMSSRWALPGALYAM